MCPFSDMVGKTATRHRRSEDISVGRWLWLAVGYPYYSHSELRRETKASKRCTMGMGGFCSSDFDELKELAKKVGRPVAQNMMLPKELLGSRWQGMGGEVRRADGCQI